MINPNIFKNLENLKQLSSMQLQPEEKMRGKDKLLVFMNAHKAKSALTFREKFQRSIYNLVSKPAAISMTALVLCGAGTSYASQYSLPGDLLYPVKVNVNEEVRGFFAYSKEAKADWLVERAQRRLEEAEELSMKGKLDDTTQTEFETVFDAHVNNARTQAEKFASENDYANRAIGQKLEDSLSTALNAHATVLVKLRGKKANEKAIQALNKLSNKVNAAIETVDKRDKSNPEEFLAPARREFRTTQRAKLLLNLEKRFSIELDDENIFINNENTSANNEKASAEVENTSTGDDSNNADETRLRPTPVFHAPEQQMGLRFERE